MTTNFLKGILVPLIVSILLVSCEKTTNEISQPEQVTSPPRIITVLGKKLPNPYSPENVKLAWENLMKTQPELIKDVTMDFNPTHVYVKFIPKNVEQLKQLQKTYGINLSDFPSFYEFKQMGNYYHDPAITEGMPTYQYATLPIETKLPNNIDYEVLEQMILIDFKKEINNTLNYNEELYVALHHELYSFSRITDFVYGNSSSRETLWRPGGELRKANNSAYPNQKVIIRDAFWIPIINGRMTSGNDGKYRCDRRVIGKVFYSVTWDLYNLDLHRNWVNSNFIKRDYNLKWFNTQF